MKLYIVFIADEELSHSKIPSCAFFSKLFEKLESYINLARHLCIHNRYLAL